MPKSPKSVIIYDGVKFFIRGKKREELILLLVNHTELMCLEVIAKCDLLITRKYLDLKQLISSVDLTLINDAFMMKKVSAEYHNKPFNGGKVMRDLAVEQMVSMIRERIQLLPNRNEFFFKPAPEDKMFTSSISDDGLIITRLECELTEMPEAVIPHDILGHIRFLPPPPLEVGPSLTPTTPSTELFLSGVPSTTDSLSIPPVCDHHHDSWVDDLDCPTPRTCDDFTNYSDTHPDTSDDSTTNSDGSSEVGSVFQALSLTLPSLCRDTSVEACYLAQPMQSVSPPQYAERIEVESSGEHSTQRAGGRTPDLFAVRNASAKSKVVSNYSRQMSVDESSRSPRN